MRLKIECILDKSEVSISYNRKIISFFKKSLEEYDFEIKKEIYDNLKEKEMSFACYFPIKNIENDIIYLKGNRFNIYITFSSLLLGINYYNAFLLSKQKENEFKICDNKFKIKNIVKIKEKEITRDIAIFKTLSPVVIRERMEKNRDRYHFLDKKGIEVLKKNIIFNLKEKFEIKELESIEIIPIDIKKTIVNLYDIKFTVSKGILAIKANRKILEYFYKKGLGSKLNSGMGMLEILE